MRDEGFTGTANVAHASVVLDMVLAGVHSELGEAPFAWLGADVARPVADIIEKQNVSEPLLVRAAPILPSPRAEAVVPPEAASLAVAAAPLVEAAWHEGEPGGVVLVVEGSSRQVEGSRKLAQAMLDAVGSDLPVAWVGGGVGADVFAKIGGLGAKRVLVLGQGPLGLLLGAKLGVEGWHASGRTTLEALPGMAVGVTYPFELLMRQPLFKRLAWQHLLAWRLAW